MPLYHNDKEAGNIVFTGKYTPNGQENATTNEAAEAGETEPEKVPATEEAKAE